MNAKHKLLRFTTRWLLYFIVFIVALEYGGAALLGHRLSRFCTEAFRYPWRG